MPKKQKRSRSRSKDSDASLGRRRESALSQGHGVSEDLAFEMQAIIDDLINEGFKHVQPIALRACMDADFSNFKKIWMNFIFKCISNDLKDQETLPFFTLIDHFLKSFSLPMVEPRKEPQKKQKMTAA